MSLERATTHNKHAPYSALDFFKMVNFHTFRPPGSLNSAVCTLCLTFFLWETTQQNF